MHDRGYQASNFQVIENILQKVGVSKKVIDEKIISTIKIISEITNNMVLRPKYNDTILLFLGKFKDLVTQFSSNLEDTLWLSELQCDITEKGRYLEKIIVNIEEPKDFLIRTLAYGYRNHLEVDPINKRICELGEDAKEGGNKSDGCILSELKKRFDFKLDIEYMKTNYAFF